MPPLKQRSTSSCEISSGCSVPPEVGGVVGSPGFEPGTYRLKVRCSTD
jgi:hypothetical protein